MICPSRKALFGVDTKNTSIRGGMEQLPSYETSKCNMDFEGEAVACSGLDLCRL